MLSWSFTKLLCYSNDLKQFHRILSYKELVIQQFYLDTNLSKIDVVFFEPNEIASKERKWKKVKLLSRVRLFSTPWTVAYQAPPSKEFS